MKVLVIEDDPLIAISLITFLTTQRYVVDLAKDGEEGLEMALEWDYDLIITDLILPKLDGINLCYKLRSQGYQAPILLLTAKDNSNDVIAGLDAGADDYLVKPYNASVLLARIRALLRRRARAIAAPLLIWENLQLNPASAEVTYLQQLVPVSPKEYGFLELFLRNPQRIFSRGAIIDQLWTTLDAPTENAVTNLIKDVRRKLKAAGMAADPFETVYGLGYRLRALPNQPLLATTLKSGVVPALLNQNPLLSLELKQQSQPNVAAIYQVIERFRDSFELQIHVLEIVVELLQADRLTADQHQQAQQEVHQLIGSLGTFGYGEASAIARQIEQLLLQPNFTDAGVRSAMIAQFDLYLAALKFELTQPPQLMPEPQAAISNATATWLVISHDVAFVSALKAEAISRGEQLHSWAIAAIAQLSLDFCPTTVLVDLDTNDLTQSPFALLQLLTQQFANSPIWVLTASDSLEERVAAARTGVQGILQKPLTASQTLAAIAQNQPHQVSPTARVLIVDDDPAMLAALEALLKPQGLQITSLAQPQKFWQTLTTTQPDLLLLDLEMPTFSGIDLCQVVRRDPKWSKIPILVVTAHTDAASIQTAFAAGADDFVRKPIIETELIARVSGWLARSRQQP